MAWKTVDAVTFSATAANNLNNKITVTLQYNDASETPTSVKLRFKVAKASDSDTVWYNDQILILYNPVSSSAPGTLFKVKPRTTDAGSWPYYSSEFTVRKTAFDAKFAIPAYWICNNGYDSDKIKWDDLTAGNVYSRYNDTSKYRGNYSKHVAANSYAISKGTTVAAAIGTGTTTIVDNGNNTFKITATKGSNGTNNTAGGPSDLKWSYDSTSYNQTYTSGANISLSIKGTGTTRTVYATSTTTATYGDDKPATASLAIKQYIAPVWSTTSGGLSITPHQKPGKTRLTLRDNWLLQWEDCTSQGCSNLWGYRIRIYVNNQSYRLFKLEGDINNSDDELTKIQPDWDKDAANRRNKYMYDRADTQSALAINPNNLVGPNGERVQPGDRISFSIYPYTLYSNGAGLYGDGRDMAYADAYVVQNAGIARVKTSGGWKEGQVWVKTSSGWKEASSVQVKTASGWKEST